MATARTALWAVLIVFTSVIPSAHAATFLDLTLTPDGSADPPGDLLELQAVSYPDDPELTVEVRAFRVIEEPAADPDALPVRTPIPIDGRAPEFRDDAGRFRLRVTMPRPSDGAIAELRLVVPYAHLDLPLGRHDMAYDVTVFRGDEVEFSAATEISAMTLTEEPRTEMSVPIATNRPGIRIETRTAIVPDRTSPDGFLERQVRVAVEDPGEGLRSETVTVNIPNGYLRASRPRYMSPAPDADPLQSQLDSLQDGGKPWSWRKREPILFATNRNIVDRSATGLSRFGNEVSDEVTYGSCFVTFPLEQHHQQGRIELPRWWERCDPDRHFSVDAMNVLDEPVFRNLLQTAIGGRDEDVLLMVHGFNNTAEFAVLRLAQLKLDMHFRGEVLLFCWPSQGSGSAYLEDETAAQASVGALKEVLRLLMAEHAAADKPEREVHLIAHSMGNRVLLNALAELAVEEQLADSEPPFGQVVLAAPDVDFATMNRVFHSAARCAERMTLYYCADDVALQASRELNRDSRIGQKGVFETGLENVDAQHANTSLLGHDYFSASNRLLVDLEMLLNLRLPAAARTQTVKSRQDNIGNQEWYFPQPLR